MKARNSYWNVISYPLSAWILYQIIFAVSAGVGLTVLGYTFLLGYGLLVFSLLFGFWNGRRSAKAYGSSMYHSAATGLILGLIAGIINLVFIVGLSAMPVGFSSFIHANGYVPGYTGIIIAAIGTWLEIVLAAVIASVVGAETR